MNNTIECDSDWSVTNILELVGLVLIFILNVFQSFEIHKFNKVNFKLSKCCELSIDDDSSD